MLIPWIEKKEWPIVVWLVVFALSSLVAVDARSRDVLVRLGARFVPVARIKVSGVAGIVLRFLVMPPCLQKLRSGHLPRWSVRLERRR